MTEEMRNYTPGNHNVFGGEIELDDFSTYKPNKKRISNQVDALNLPKTLSAKKKKIDEGKRYAHMTLEELREMKLISNTDGRPVEGLTDAKWQKEFEIRKAFIKPYPKTVKKLGGKYSQISGKWNEEVQGTYSGETNWQEYCSFINDALMCIRAGQVYYCYFIYQILDLAKFHFDDLRTRYCDGYFEVWLEDK